MSKHPRGFAAGVFAVGGGEWQEVGICVLDGVVIYFVWERVGYEFES